MSKKVIATPPRIWAVILNRFLSIMIPLLRYGNRSCAGRSEIIANKVSSIVNSSRKGRGKVIPPIFYIEYKSFYHHLKSCFFLLS